jgi:nucleoside-diphosphate-sugar epimerase
MNLHGRHILITGANGFIGARLAERLADEEGARVRGLVRDASRISHHVFEPAIGDVVDADAVRRAVDGCDIVVHCAAMQGGRSRINEYRRVNVQGTLNLLRAAKDAGASRFIHISTINAHGIPPPRDANADSPLVFAGDFYSISKAEGERAARQFARENNFPLVVIRPGCTYGPRSQAWTLTPLRRVQRGAPVLIGSGDGICNAVYIDNLIDLILLAMKEDAAIGQAFIGAEGRGVTWREFYGAYARMLGIARVNSMPRWFARAAATGFELLGRIDGRGARVSRASIEFYAHRVVFDISKAQKLLGYAPRVSFAEGMRMTEAWLIAEGMIKQT